MFVVSFVCYTACVRKAFLVGAIILFVLSVGLLVKAYLTSKNTTSLQQSKIDQELTSSITSSEKAIEKAQFSIQVYAEDLGKARDLEFTSSGTLLLSIPDQGRVVSLPDENNDGKADKTITIADNLRWPHGLAFYNNRLFVASEDKVTRYEWDETNKQARLDKVLFSLPTGGNHHSYTITFDKAGRMFVALGSTCNVCIENHPWRSSVIVSNENGDSPRVFARGLRNAPFIIINSTTNELWGTEMGRDYLGDNLPPDEVNIIQDNKNYGWPYCYSNRITDDSFKQGQPINCQTSVSPTFEIPAHSAPLGLTFINSPRFPEDWQGDLLVSYHGSWNRTVPTGYKVVRLNVEGSKIIGSEDFIAEFPNINQGKARPVDVIFDKTGNLYISDDERGVVYRVTQ